MQNRKKEREERHESKRGIYQKDKSIQKQGSMAYALACITLYHTFQLHPYVRCDSRI